MSHQRACLSASFFMTGTIMGNLSLCDRCHFGVHFMLWRGFSLACVADRDYTRRIVKTNNSLWTNTWNYHHAHNNSLCGRQCAVHANIAELFLLLCCLRVANENKYDACGKRPLIYLSKGSFTQALTAGNRWPHLLTRKRDTTQYLKIVTIIRSC